MMKKGMIVASLVFSYSPFLHAKGFYSFDSVNVSVCQPESNSLFTDQVQGVIRVSRAVKKKVEKSETVKARPNPLLNGVTAKEICYGVYLSYKASECSNLFSKAAETICYGLNAGKSSDSASCGVLSGDEADICWGWYAGTSRDSANCGRLEGNAAEICRGVFAGTSRDSANCGRLTGDAAEICWGIYAGRSYDSADCNRITGEAAQELCWGWYAGTSRDFANCNRL